MDSVGIAIRYSNLAEDFHLEALRSLVLHRRIRIFIAFKQCFMVFRCPLILPIQHFVS